jgi:3-oxoadipate enol-lactonase
MAWTSNGGVSLHYKASGEGASIILIHELGGSLQSWDDVAKRLPADFRVLRYDQRGAGMSEKVRQPFSMNSHVGDLEAVIAASALDAPYMIVSCAAGAGIALRFAEKRGERVSRLVLCCPALSVSEERKKYLIVRSELAAREGMWSVVAETLARSYPESVAQDRAAYEDYRARFLANDPVSYGLANRAVSEGDSKSLGTSVQCPCLVLAGKHDPLRPEAEVLEVAERIPNARFALVDAGHLPHVQAPELLAGLIMSFARGCDPQEMP